MGSSFIFWFQCSSSLSHTQLVVMSLLLFSFLQVLGQRSPKSQKGSKSPTFNKGNYTLLLEVLLGSRAFHSDRGNSTSVLVHHCFASKNARRDWPSTVTVYPKQFLFSPSLLFPARTVQLLWLPLRPLTLNLGSCYY